MRKKHKAPTGKTPTGNEPLKGKRPMGMAQVPSGFRPAGGNRFKQALGRALRSRPLHTITPEYEASLWEIANRLPVPDGYGEPVTGAQLLADKPDTKGYDGAPIDPEKLYYLRSEDAINAHMDAMREAYQRAGEPAVVAYLQPFAAFLKEE